MAEKKSSRSKHQDTALFMNRKWRTILMLVMIPTAFLVMNSVATQKLLTALLYKEDGSQFAIQTKKKLGTIVLLASSKWRGYTFFKKPGDRFRFCLLAHAIQSIDQHLNSKFGPYDINIVYAFDHDPDDEDGSNGEVPYEPLDFDMLREYVAPERRYLLHFHPIYMYSRDALEPNTTLEQIDRWRHGEDGAVAGRNVGYQSMCRLWSGRIQQMAFMDEYKYYMRIDDDAYFTRDLTIDPFVRMEAGKLTYAYRREDKDHWGIEKLAEVAKSHVDFNRDNTPFLTKVEHKGDNNDTLYEYKGKQPYNNFHISLIDFWRSPLWQAFWKDANRNHLFMKYRNGDANVHAIAVMMIDQQPKLNYAVWPELPYLHNVNDDSHYPPDHWKDECNTTYVKFGVVPPRKKEEG